MKNSNQEIAISYMRMKKKFFFSNHNNGLWLLIDFRISFKSANLINFY